MLKPIRLANLHRVSDTLQERNVYSLIGGVRDFQYDINDGFRGQSRHGCRSYMFYGEGDGAKGVPNLGFEAFIKNGPLGIVSLKNDAAVERLNLAHGRGCETVFRGWHVRECLGFD